MGLAKKVLKKIFPHVTFDERANRYILVKNIIGTDIVMIYLTWRSYRKGYDKVVRL